MFGSPPPATRAIILFTVAVFLLQPFLPVNSLVLWPLQSGLFRPWQLLTYALIHEGWLHIFFDMFALYIFAGPLERVWGPTRFVTYYLVCVAAAALTQLAVQYEAHQVYPTAGASGGVFGVLLAFAMYFPQERLIILPIPIPMPAWFFVTLYAVAELIFGVTGIEPGIAHFAHLGGLLGGALMLLYLRRQRAS